MLPQEQEDMTPSKDIPVWCYTTFHYMMKELRSFSCTAFMALIKVTSPIKLGFYNDIILHKILKFRKKTSPFKIYNVQLRSLNIAH